MCEPCWMGVLLEWMTVVEATLLWGTGLGANARGRVAGLSACCLLVWARCVLTMADDV